MAKKKVNENEEAKINAKYAYEAAKARGDKKEMARIKKEIDKAVLGKK